MPDKKPTDPMRKLRVENIEEATEISEVEATELLLILMERSLVQEAQIVAIKKELETLKEREL